MPQPQESAIRGEKYCDNCLLDREQPAEIIGAEPEEFVDKDWSRSYGGFTTQILRTGAITFPVKSRRDRIRFTAPSHTMTSQPMVTAGSAPRRSVVREAYQGPAFSPARIDGRDSQRQSNVYAQWKTQDHSERLLAIRVWKRNDQNPL